MSVRSIEAEVSIKSGVQAECTIGREVIVEVHEDVTLESLTATANGQYAPAEGVDGYSDVTVAVPERIPVTESLSVTENGTYEPSEGIDGYDRVVVNVPPTIPDISPLTVTDDGVYQASGDGYNPVTVNTGVGALRQEIASAETASGCSPLTEGLTALTTYANEVTGQEDETLSDAIETLASGFGKSGLLDEITLTEDYILATNGCVGHWVERLGINRLVDLDRCYYIYDFTGNSYTNMAANIMFAFGTNGVARIITGRQNYSNWSADASTGRAFYAAAGTIIKIYRIER